VSLRPPAAPAGGLLSAQLGEVESALRDARLEGWLLYDYRGQNGIAQRALGLEDVSPTRRFFYWIPAEGIPVLLAHASELETFGDLPGEGIPYDGWASLRTQLGKLLPNRGAIAMEHQEFGGHPDLSRVDAGTVALVRSYGPSVVSSGDLVNRFLGPWRDKDASSHARALAALIEVEHEIVAFLESTPMPLESEVRTRAIAAIESRGLVLGRPPMVASGPHTRHPHHGARASCDRRIQPRDLVIIELIAREASRGSPFAHRSLVASLEEVQREHAEAFAVAREAREVAIDLVRERARKGSRLLGFEVDEAARLVLARSGSELLHRTGYHLGPVPLSGEACTFDAFEVHDIREALAGLAWSVHPGVYREEFGVRATASIQRTEYDIRVIDPGQDEIRVIARR
jgi:Xaa-Pro aminopeptidase